MNNRSLLLDTNRQTKAVTDYKQKILTYVSKSISYKVSPNGTLTGLHFFDDAASDGCAGTPSIPVADAKALAATVDPV